MKEMHPDFGPEISLEDAMEKLNMWSAAGEQHAYLFNSKYEGVIAVLSKIIKVEDNFIICKGEFSQLFFRLDGAKFVYGPMALMEYPVKQESTVEGLHIFLQTGNYLFISSQAQLPNMESPWLEVL